MIPRLTISVIIYVSLICSVYAQIVSDKNAPFNQQPNITHAPNKIPLVNIQTPSSKGVSRNSYQQFDVNKAGVILNNSQTNVHTQLGGWVMANPNLSKGSARIILNEVNSSNPSNLKGFVEVSGTKAQVIIANPHGISCDGCGFINANKATLTTGIPILQNGALDGYRVQGGNISINGRGLNAINADYTNLIAHSVQINAGVWANKLRVTTGIHLVDVDAQPITHLQNNDNVPYFALDVAELGGMYANHIF